VASPRGSLEGAEAAHSVRMKALVETPRPPEDAREEPSAESPVEEDRGLLKRIGEGILVVSLLVVKLGIKLKALFLLLFKLKVATTFASMFVSIGAYALIWGWAFAAGFVLLLLLHELGHVIQLRREGIPASAPLFIPFVGAVISAESLGEDAAAEARVGLAGPILGSLASLVPLGLWFATGEQFWQALAYVGFFLNLFNLLPVLPLDGGRAMAAVSPWIWVVGFAALVPLLLYFPDPILFLILVFGLIEAWRRWQARKTPEGHAYFEVPARTRSLIAATYLMLAAVLVAGMSATFLDRAISDEPGAGAQRSASAKQPVKGFGPTFEWPPRFTLNGVDALRGGRVHLTVTVPKAGKVYAGDKDDPAMGTRFPGSPDLVLKKIAVRRKGALSFTLDPTAAARARLAREGRVKMKLTVAYRPQQRTLPQRRTAEVTLRGS